MILPLFYVEIMNALYFYYFIQFIHCINDIDLILSIHLICNKFKSLNAKLYTNLVTIKIMKLFILF